MRVCLIVGALVMCLAVCSSAEERSCPLVLPDDLSMVDWAPARVACGNVVPYNQSYNYTLQDIDARRKWEEEVAKIPKRSAIEEAQLLLSGLGDGLPPEPKRRGATPDPAQVANCKKCTCAIATAIAQGLAKKRVLVLGKPALDMYNVKQLIHMCYKPDSSGPGLGLQDTFVKLAEQDPHTGPFTPKAAGSPSRGYDPIPACPSPPLSFTIYEDHDSHWMLGDKFGGVCPQEISIATSKASAPAASALWLMVYLIAIAVLVG